MDVLGTRRTTRRGRDVKYMYKSARVTGPCSVGECGLAACAHTRTSTHTTCTYVRVTVYSQRITMPTQTHAHSHARATHTTSMDTKQVRELAVGRNSKLYPKPAFKVKRELCCALNDIDEAGVRFDYVCGLLKQR